MRILHTSDWHLGKKLAGYSRHAEQKAAINSIYGIARERAVELILVAGDIFDSPVPPSESEELFYESALKLASVCPVVYLSGNHDDPVRLSAARSLAARNNILILTADAASSELITRSSEGFIELKINGGTVGIAYLPFPNDPRLLSVFDGEDGQIPDFSSAAGTLLSRYASNFSPESVNIVMGHFDCVGAERAGDERLLNRSVLIKDFPVSQYAALGHIHRRQTVNKDKNIYYSGSLLQYSFDDAVRKSVNIVDVQPGCAAGVERVYIEGGKQVLLAKVYDIEEARKVLDENPDSLVSLELHMQSVPNSAYRGLRSSSNLLSIKAVIPKAERAEEVRSYKDDAEVFRAYYKRTKSADAPAELVDLFLEILNSGD